MKLDKLKKFYSLGSSIFIKFIAVALGIFTSRWINTNIEAEKLSDLNIILVSNAVIFGSLGLGIPTLVQKFYTDHSDLKKYAKFWTTILFFQIFLYFIGLSIVGIIYLLTNISEFWIFAAIYTAQYILLLDTNFKSIADAYNRSWVFSFTDLLAKVLVIACFYSVSFFGKVDGLEYFSYVIFVVYVLEYILDWIFQKKYTTIASPDWSIIKANSGFFWYVGLSSFLSGISSTTDRWFLKFFGYDAYTIVGYSNSYKIVEMSLIPQALAIPVILSWAKREIDKNQQPGLIKDYIRMKLLFWEKISKMTFPAQVMIKWGIFSGLVGLFTGFGVLFLGWIGLILIDPNRAYYDLSLQTIPYLGVALFPSGFIGFAGGMTVLFEKEKYDLWSYMLFSVSALALYLLLIPGFGAIGAAIATLLSGFIFATFKLYLLLRAFKHYKTKLASSNLKSH